MKIKVLLIIAILLCGVIALSACSGSGKVPENEALPSVAKVSDNSLQPEGNTAEVQKTQEQKEMTISMNPIEGWNNVEGSTALVQYIKEGNSVIVTCDSMPADAGTPEKFIEYVKVKLGNAVDNIVFSDIAEIGISDPEKHFLAYDHDIKVGGTAYQMKGWVTYIFYEGKAYTLTCAALSDNFSALEDDFRTFIESFKLIPKE